MEQLSLLETIFYKIETYKKCKIHLRFCRDGNWWWYVPKLVPHNFDYRVSYVAMEPTLQTIKEMIDSKYDGDIIY